MVDLTYEIGGLLREGAERAVSKPKGALRTARFVSEVLAHLLGDRQGPLRTRVPDPPCSPRLQPACAALLQVLGDRVDAVVRDLEVYSGTYR
jgi:hypothetical protein